MSNFYHTKSIIEAYQFLNLGKPLHPLIMIVREWPEIDFDFSNTKMTADFYVISLKGNKSGSFGYGRNSYDYEEGTLTFTAPNQALSFSERKEGAQEKSWTILFHPDLIRKSELGRIIKEYSFFDYEVNEALHISDNEKEMLNVLVKYIETELQ